MNPAWLLVNGLSALLLLPLNLVLVAALGFGLQRRWPRLGRSVTGLALAVLLVLSTQAGARLLLAPLEAPFVHRSQQSASVNAAQAIVVLGGGRLRQAPEYDNADVPSLEALSRLRHAARLQRQTGLPLLVTGGQPDAAMISEAQLMAQVLQQDFAVPVRWLETQSGNTAENAALSAAMLHPLHIKRIWLVTDAVHMRRAQQVFRYHGFETLAAPTTFMAQGPLRVIDFVPHARELARSNYALHEWIGLLWYRLRHL